MAWEPDPDLIPNLPILGWTADGPAVPIDPKLGWWVVRQLKGYTEVLTEFDYELLVHLTGATAVTEQSPASILVHLMGSSTVTESGIFVPRLAGQATQVQYEGSGYAVVHYYATGQTNISIQSTAQLLVHLFATTNLVGNAPASIVPKLTAATAAVIESSAVAAFQAMSAARVDITATGAFTYNIPAACKYIDVIVLGGGGGGREGDGGFGATGNGGLAGTYASATYQRGVDLPWTQSTITGSVGAAGPAGAKNAGNVTASSRGGTTTAGALSAVGGDGGSGTNGNAGASPGNRTQGSMTMTGGATAPSGSGRTVGKPPGGGGGGGAGGIFNGQTAGMAGSRGQASFTARQ